MSVVSIFIFTILLFYLNFILVDKVLFSKKACVSNWIYCGERLIFYPLGYGFCFDFAIGLLVVVKKFFRCPYATALF